MENPYKDAIQLGIKSKAKKVSTKDGSTKVGSIDSSQIKSIKIPKLHYGHRVPLTVDIEIYPVPFKFPYLGKKKKGTGTFSDIIDV